MTWSGVCGVFELSHTVFEALHWTAAKGGVTLVVILQWWYYYDKSCPEPGQPRFALFSRSNLFSRRSCLFEVLTRGSLSHSRRASSRELQDFIANLDETSSKADGSVLRLG